jgi:hypothetical protein
MHILESSARLALQACTGLQHLSIVAYGTFDQLIHLLSTMSSTDLIAIVIATPMAYFYEFDAVALDKVLAQSKFSNLRSFRLLKTHGDNATLLTPRVRASMPLVSARGILY